MGLWVESETSGRDSHSTHRHSSPQFILPRKERNLGCEGHLPRLPDGVSRRHDSRHWVPMDGPVADPVEIPIVLCRPSNPD